TSEAYWKRALQGPWAHMQMMDPEGGSLAMMAQQQANQSSGWLVCDGCSSNFSFDRKKAKAFAENQNSRPAGSGPANVQDVARAAAKAWKSLFGSSPSSIRMI
ncbi:hypothetical protein ACFL4L_03995, partial [bacterium]